MGLNEKPWEVNSYSSSSIYNFKKFFGLGNRGENSVENERDEEEESVKAERANESDEEDEDNNNDSDNDDGDLLMPVVEWIGGMIPKLAK